MLENFLTMHPAGYFVEGDGASDIKAIRECIDLIHMRQELNAMKGEERNMKFKLLKAIAYALWGISFAGPYSLAMAASPISSLQPNGMRSPLSCLLLLTGYCLRSSFRESSHPFLSDIYLGSHISCVDSLIALLNKYELGAL